MFVVICSRSVALAMVPQHAFLKAVTDRRALPSVVFLALLFGLAERWPVRHVQHELLSVGQCARSDMNVSEGGKRPQPCSFGVRFSGRMLRILS